ncbi:hypothetical protein [Vibrio salinus]|uniref:hypothetical protein n=1 Tax=Vibrio salinus TaxID=2899784 RepID=UPI001E349062|nr:hypothetical protein [Vibrio salinus]MCE0494160.1 hypothetical protein [Vibrio salinus]
MCLIKQSFPRLVLILTSLCYVNNVFSGESICEEIKLHINPAIEQSEFNESIFGIKRKLEEIKSISDVNNVIGKASRHYSEYFNLKECFYLNKNRFLQRNSDIFKLLLIGMLNEDFKSDKFDDIKKYVLKSLRSDDGMVIDKAIFATVFLHDNMFIGALKDIVINSKSISTRKDAIDAIGSIYTEASKESLNELREQVPPDLVKEIDETLSKNYW